MSSHDTFIDVYVIHASCLPLQPSPHPSLNMPSSPLSPHDMPSLPLGWCEGHGVPQVEANLDTNPETKDGYEEEQESSSENARPLLFFYDSEATGYSVYNDCITEIAAKVTGVPLSSISNPSFSNLIHTSRNIPERGKEIVITIITIMAYLL